MSQIYDILMVIERQIIVINHQDLQEATPVTNIPK